MHADATGLDVLPKANLPEVELGARTTTSACCPLKSRRKLRRVIAEGTWDAFPAARVAPPPAHASEASSARSSPRTPASVS